MIDKKEFEETYVKAHADIVRKVNTLRGHYELGVIPAALALEKIGCELDRFEKFLSDLHEEVMDE